MDFACPATQSTLYTYECVRTFLCTQSFAADGLIFDIQSQSIGRRVIQIGDQCPRAVL